GVMDATLFGEAIHELVDETVVDEQISRGIGVSPMRSEAQGRDAHATEEVKIRKIEPTLEDVFVTLTTQAQRARVEDRRTANASPRPSPPMAMGEREDVARKSKIRPRTWHGL